MIALCIMTGVCIAVLIGLFVWALAADRERSKP